VVREEVTQEKPISTVSPMWRAIKPDQHILSVIEQDSVSLVKSRGTTRATREDEQKN